MTMTLKNIVTLGIGALLFLVALVIIPQLFTNVDAKEITVIQHISGELSVVAEPGWAWQGMGKITHYPRRDQFSFSCTIDQGNSVDESIQTRRGSCEYFRNN